MPLLEGVEVEILNAFCQSLVGVLAVVEDLKEEEGVGTLFRDAKLS